MSARDALSERLLLDALAAELAPPATSGHAADARVADVPPTDGSAMRILLIGMQTCASVAEANGLVGADCVRLLHLDGAAGAVDCRLGNVELFYDAAAEAALPVGSFGIVGLNVEAARNYRVLRELTIWAATRVWPGGALLLAGPRKGGAEVAAEAVRPLVTQLELLTYRKGHRVYRACPSSKGLTPNPSPTRRGEQPARVPPLRDLRRPEGMSALQAARARGPFLPVSQPILVLRSGGQPVPSVRRVDEGEGARGGEVSQLTAITLRGQTLQLVQDDRIFARGQLDPATRMLAETFEAPSGSDLLDLGCGNGVLGILAALLDPTSRCTLVDADPLAVAAARRGAALSGAANVTVTLSNVLAALPGQTFDVVVTNPPFHRGRREDRALGARFIAEGAAVLRPGGRLWVVCNRFLPYERVLRSLLGDVREVAGDRAYKLLTGTR